MDYLPVFLDLRGRAVVVVGGGEVAARKIELLRSAQARIRVIAPVLAPELATLRSAGHIEHLCSEFVPAHLEGAALVIAATDDPQINATVHAAASAQGLFVNVVDDARHCSFIMPAIIDRTPLLVAVGTSGTAPVLARHIRTLLEAVLPQRLGTLAALAGRWRERVRSALPALPARRRFWDEFLEGPLARQLLHGATDEASLERQLAALLSNADTARAKGGEVWLIGAGPGDPDLLTLRAQQLLQQCDVVLYDRLVDPAILERVRRDAERVFVGKESGQHRVTQQRIHSLLLEYAGRGLRVARLKGGDPLIFGRGGEELAVLAAAGIPVTIVPGVTAALGAAAGAGIALTQRGLAQSVTFVTAMGEGAAALDWRALAAPLQTVVFYMGVAQLPRIVERLIAHGAPRERAAALIERATLPGQRVVSGRLYDIDVRARAARISAPALLVVGDTVPGVLQAGRSSDAAT
ncbi:MAG: siroheme synthase CysG [Steroidobacteraceae bacterium]|jgi:uroporphyrin-III C-methyltransferase/precorrin-2 dehydrogenase/sirohydrochlorin ferrochelatase